MRVLMVHDDRIYEAMGFNGTSQGEACGFCALQGGECTALNKADADFCDNLQTAAGVNRIIFKEIK